MRKDSITVVLFVLILCGSVFLYQCGSDDPSEPSTPDETIISDPSFSQHIQPIFDNNCALALCHVAGTITELDLSQGVKQAREPKVFSVFLSINILKE